MSQQNYCVDIDGEKVICRLDGSLEKIGDDVLLDHDDDLIKGTDWYAAGYRVTPLFDQESYKQFHAAMIAHFKKSYEAIINRPFKADITDYHKVTSDAEHLELVTKTAVGWSLDEVDFPLTRIAETVSKACGREVSSLRPDTRTMTFQLRVVRPNRPDFNPPHRDVWLDRLRNAVNIYIPLAGSGPKSSLPMVPKSHRWREDQIARTSGGAKVNGVSYTVPSVFDLDGDLAMTRPAVQENEVLIFSPYLVHGCAANLNDDKTRLSLEMRFWRAP